MKNPLPPQDPLNENSTGADPVTRGLLRERAIELAANSGRAAHEVTKADWDQARHDLSGKPDVDPKQAILESVPESERWNPVPGSPGHQTPDTPNEDEEDAEGRNDSARLVDEGVNEAERDQIAQAARGAGKKDPLRP